MRPLVSPCRLVLVLLAVAPCVARAGDLTGLLRGLAAPLKAAHRAPPDRAADDDVERLAAEIDWLEHHIDVYGSIVAKSPDVWGQSRLLRHRVEYEEQMRAQLPLFEERTHAALRRSDQAFLGMALAVEGATGRRRGPEAVAVPAVTTFTAIQGLLPDPTADGRGDPPVIARTAPFAVPSAPAGLAFDGGPVSLEPTIHLDHLSRYLCHLAELRRVNEGDDTADSPGYALALVRFPVSILPGGATRKGHGAEVTVIAEPCLGDDLLPATFRPLVINDLVDMIAPALTWCVNDADCLRWAATLAADDTPPEEVEAAARALSARLPALAPAAAPAVKTRRARLPVPFSQLAEMAGVGPMAILIRDTHTALAAHPASTPCIHYVDVRGFVAEELEAAYDLLERAELAMVWEELSGLGLADAVRGRRVADVAAARCRFLERLGDHDPTLQVGGRCCDPAIAAVARCRTTTAVLAWGILVESALLDERLRDDIRDVTGGGTAPTGWEPGGSFAGPRPPPESRRAFAEYVRCRWPLRVFALDPVVAEQNVEDSYARRRELQIALALAAASGRAGSQAVVRMARRLETELATVALNQTAVGFSHGADTFGWRFLPRVQSPPTRGALATLAETVRGTTTDADLAQRQIEPGQRECTALVVVPSFVPSVTFDVRTNGFSLTHPASTDTSIRQSLRLSRAVQSMKQSQAACARCAHLYRDGEIPRLLRRVDQLERELPLQTLQAPLPYENTAGGFELFSSGITELAPELQGWYGAPGIDPTGATTLFLIGKGFSLHDTQIVAGGRRVPFSLLSREVVRVEIPPGVQVLEAPACAGSIGTPIRLAAGIEPLPAPVAGGLVLPGPPTTDTSPAPPEAVGCCGREVVDVHLATPYGVSGHLLVPVARPGIAPPGGPAFQPGSTLGLSFAVSRSDTTRALAARVDEHVVLPADDLTIRVPDAFLPPGRVMLACTLRDAASHAVVATFSHADPPFDAAGGGYRLAGGDLRNFLGDTSRPASDKTLRGAVKPWLDAMLARGGLAEADAAAHLVLTATLVADGRSVPVGGGIDVTVTRRTGTAAADEDPP